MATLDEIAAVGQCGLSLNQDSGWPLAPDMVTSMIVVILLDGGACTAKEEHGGTQVIWDTGISSGILISPPSCL